MVSLSNGRRLCGNCSAFVYIRDAGRVISLDWRRRRAPDWRARLREHSCYLRQTAAKAVAVAAASRAPLAS